MRFATHTRKEAPFLALFDVGATSVGVALSHEEHGTAKLLWHARIDYSYKTQDDYGHYERSMYATLLEAGMRLMSEGVKEARAQQEDFKATHMRVVCVLAPPWFFSTVTTGTKEWDRPTEVQERIRATLVEDAQRQAYESEGATSWRTVVGDAEVLETVPQLTLLNGYPTETFAGQSVTRAAISVYFTFIGTDVKKHVSEILERVLPNHDTTITTSTVLLARLHRATMGGGEHHGYLVEVGGHVTSIATLERGVLSFVSTIPFGTNDILTATAPDAQTAEEARGALFVLLKGKAMNTDNPLPENVHKVLTEWREGIYTALRTHSKGAVPHNLLFLMVGSRWLSLLVPFLSEPWVVPGIRKTRTPVVIPVSITVQPPDMQHAPDKKQTWPALPDSRLLVFTHSLFYSSRT